MPFGFVRKHPVSFSVVWPMVAVRVCGPCVVGRQWGMSRDKTPLAAAFCVRHRLPYIVS